MSSEAQAQSRNLQQNDSRPLDCARGDTLNAFDWQKEFPEVFAKGGFDVVLGNPPYVQLQSMGAMSDVYAKCGYESYNKSADIYCLFYERGVQLLKEKGLLGFIASNKWLKVNYGEALRNFIVTKTNPILLVDFPGVQIFPDATVDPQILVLAKEPYKKQTVSCVYKGKSTDVANYVEKNKVKLCFTKDAWKIYDNITVNIFDKMQKIGKPLKDWNIEINNGIKTGYNDAFYIDEETKNQLIAEDFKSAELIKPFLRGRDIKAWSSNSELYMINTHNGVKEINLLPIDVEKYPAIKNHLDKFYDKLAKRGDKGITPYNLRNCAYLKDFEKPKIIYPNMTKFFPFIYNEDKTLINQKCYFIVAKDESVSLKYLTAIFNSKLCKLWIWHNCPELGDDRREIGKAYFENFCVPLASTEKSNVMSSGGVAAVETSTENSEVDLSTSARGDTQNSTTTPSTHNLVTSTSALAELADKMLDLNAKFAKLTNNFWTLIKANYNLEKIPSALGEFYKLDFKEFLKISKIKVPLSEQGELLEFFETSKNQCNALKTQIANVENEINKAVYALYGISAEEIKIIEGGMDAASE